MAEIRLEAVEHSYGDSAVPAVSSLNLAWPDGGACALLGPSGCGKTTLLGIISGLLTPRSGRVFYNGRDVTRSDPRSRNVAQVFQFPVVYGDMTVRGNLEFPLRNRGVPEGERRTRAAQIAELLELQQVLDRRAHSLSPEEKQMLSLGRGLVRKDTAAVLFDEPLTVVDPGMRWVLRRKLRELQAELGLMMIYVTHDQTEALTFADHIAVMNEGRMLQFGSPEDLFARPTHSFVGHFIGSPGMNLLPCRLAESASQASGAGEARVRTQGRSVALTEDASAPWRLGIRPEHVQLLEDAQRPPATEHGAGLALSARVLRARSLGAGALLSVQLGDAILRVRTDRSEPAAGLSPNQRVRLWLAAERLHLFDDRGVRLEGGA